DLGQESPPLIGDRPASDVPRRHLADEGLDVVAHQIELVVRVLVGGMDGHLRRRQPEDEPPTTDVDVRQMKDVAQETAIRLWFRAVDDRMRADDHVGPPSILIVPPGVTPPASVW